MSWRLASAGNEYIIQKQRSGTAHMTTVQLRKLYESRPFQPFRLRMADGRSLYVGHPEWMAFSPSGRTVVIHERDDSFQIIDLLLVTSIEVKANGKKHVRKR